MEAIRFMASLQKPLCDIDIYIYTYTSTLEARFGVVDGCGRFRRKVSQVCRGWVICIKEIDSGFGGSSRTQPF